MTTKLKIRYGSSEVTLIRRRWKVHERVPYKKTYRLKPGQNWRDAETTEKQWESYVIEDDGDYVPSGARIAQELIDEGAEQAVFTELWGGCVLVDHTLTCVEPSGRIQEILETIKENNDGKLGGLPDVIGIFPEDRIVLIEAKCVDTKDSLSQLQHDLADKMRTLFGDNLDLKVVEWGSSIEEL